MKDAIGGDDQLMSELITVAKVADLKPGEGKVVAVGDREVAVFNVAGQFHAVDNICPHRGGPLGEGVIDGHVVTCPWHGWRFDVTTGTSPVVPTAKVDKLECVVEGDDVKVRV
jgi:nitrite reductase (NADH) small subunit